MLENDIDLNETRSYYMGSQIWGSVEIGECNTAQHNPQVDVYLNLALLTVK